MPSVTVAAVALDWHLPLAPDQVEVIHNDEGEGKALAFKLPNVGSHPSAVSQLCGA